MNEPDICLSVLGPSTAQGNGPGIVDWCEGGTKMVAHVPFYLLAEQKGKKLGKHSIVIVKSIEGPSFGFLNRAILAI